jgi:hypothetical protein
MVRCILRLIGASYFVLAVAFAAPAEARRVALVIGNASYKVGPLQNPIKDATAVADALAKKLAFDKVLLRTDLGAEGFRLTLLEFARESAGAHIGVVYFAGHGTESGGRNFLVPVDARLARASDLDLEAITLDTVLGQLSGVTKLKLVILDACRNNLFPLSGVRRSVGRGLARIEPEGNALVAYAAKDGTTADDGAGRPHSPFTEALLKHMATPGLEVRQLFGYVRDEVTSATAHQQQPYLYGSLGGQGLFLQPPGPAPQSVAPAPVPTLAPVVQPQTTEVERAWTLVKDSPSIPVLDAFRRQYGASNLLYDRLAETRIEELKKLASAPAASAFEIPPSPREPVVPPAALEPAAPPPALARLLQVELQRVGCNPGSIDGVWGDKGEAALERFARHAKLSVPTDAPTLAALEAVKGRAGRVCPLECGPGTIEKNGACVARPVPARERDRVRDAPAPKRAQRRPRSDKAKGGMCWAIDLNGRGSTIVPCTDSRATMKAY